MKTEGLSFGERLKRKLIKMALLAIALIVAWNLLVPQPSHRTVDLDSTVEVNILSDNQVNIGNGWFGGNSNPIHNAQCVWLLGGDYSHQTGVCQINAPAPVSINR